MMQRRLGLFMFHGVGFNVESKTRLEEKLLKERLDGLLSDQKRIGAIIRDRTGISEKEIEDLFREAQTKDATYAVGCGIVHEVKDVEIPPGTPIQSLVFKR